MAVKPGLGFLGCTGGGIPYAHVVTKWEICVNNNDYCQEFAMVSKRISDERQRLGLSQSDLGKVWNVGRSAVAMVETDRSPLYVERLIALETLGFDIQYILFGQRSAQIASRLLDWQMIAQILQGIRKWSDDHNIPLNPDKEALFLRVLYDLFTASGKFDEAVMNATLPLAA
jgi:transcriptional regulator with XRE-family HTH domain